MKTQTNDFGDNAEFLESQPGGSDTDLSGCVSRSRFAVPTVVISYRGNSLYDAIMAPAIEIVREKLSDLNLQYFVVPVGTEKDKIPALYSDFISKPDTPILDSKTLYVADNTTNSTLKFESAKKGIDLDELVGTALRSAMLEKFGQAYFLFLEDCTGANNAERFEVYQRAVKSVLLEILSTAFPVKSKLPERLVIFTEELTSHYPFVVFEQQNVDSGTLLVELFQQLGMPRDRIHVVKNVEELICGPEIDCGCETGGLEDNLDSRPASSGIEELMQRLGKHDDDGMNFLDDFDTHQDLLNALNDAKSVYFFGDRHILNSQTMLDQLATFWGISNIEALKHVQMDDVPKKSRNGKKNGRHKEDLDYTLRQGVSDSVKSLRDLVGLGNGEVYKNRVTAWFRFPLENLLVDLNRVGLVDGNKSITPETLTPMVARSLIEEIQKRVTPHEPLQLPVHNARKGKGKERRATNGTTDGRVKKAK